VGSSDIRVRYSYSGSGWSMRTIDPATGEPRREARRLRPIAWSIGAVLVCIVISLAIFFLLSRQPERVAGVASRGEPPALQPPAAKPETVASARDLVAPNPVTLPFASIPAEPKAIAEIPGLPPPSDDVVHLTPAPPPAIAAKPAETKPAETKPAETKPAILVRRPPQSPAATSGQVARIVLTSASAQSDRGDPISSPIVLAAGQEKRAVLHTELRHLAGQTVSHRWQRNGQTVAVIPFKVRGDRWRVRSSKRLTASLKGSWEVVVVDSRGETLASRSFVVR
jgi:Protein of unknown function (DUF2914)